MDILIVEDDRKIGSVLALRLRASGHRPLLALDAMAGVTMAVKHRPDLVIVDLTMPAGGGFSVIERLQALPETGDMPFIVLTANDSPENRQRAAELGAAFLEKPYDADELLSTIARALSARAAAV